MNFEHINSHLTEENIGRYRLAEPFENIYIDKFLSNNDAIEISALFPKPDESWYIYKNDLEYKRAQDNILKIPDTLATKLLWFNSAPFVNFLEKLTGITGLIPDPHFRGGLLHSIPENGYLDLHTDYGIHSRLGLYRRINVLIYFNLRWKDEYGGELELFSSDFSKHKSIAPLYNRMVCFNTNATSFHGHPQKWKSTNNRISLAFYYYTSYKPNEAVNEKSTLFVPYPGEPFDAKKQALRDLRSKGRIASNV